MSAKRLTAGILAHVDAGKTTLSEAILYETGCIRTQGRVDHQDAFLDTDAQERARGITIFSKQAEVQLFRGNAELECQLTLLDTPGHTDFSAEMERTLSVLDYAILVISAANGVQGHVETLWKLLKRYQIPVFLFINKMDQAGADKNRVLTELQSRLSAGCIDFDARAKQDEAQLAAFWENAALLDEALLEEYLQEGSLSDASLREAIAARKLFPCCFGSALKDEGVLDFLRIFSCFTKEKTYPETFGARVYKITRDAQGNRLTHLKVTGGLLRARQQIFVPEKTQEAEEESVGHLEKADQLRVYNGTSFTPVQEAPAGSIVAVTGLGGTSAGMGLGVEQNAELPLLVPLFTYSVVLPFDTDVRMAYAKLKELEEEIPELSIGFYAGEIHVRLMGEVQTEILQNLIRDRYHLEVTFGEGRIIYEESILTPAEGVGHFEPLKHYAEVHLLLEPAERGSGIHVDSRCPEDVLDRNFQRLVLTHLMEKQHRGVLCGAPLTDVRITLLSGRAHQKHTEGGDFRQAVYRAVRNGLMRAKSVLLEPYYRFRLSVPRADIGRAMADIQRMSGKFETPIEEDGKAILCGRAPVSSMRGYQTQVTAYTRGFGQLACTFDGYDICHNEEEVISAFAYDPEADAENPSGSVFCTHGAGFYVPWDEVPDYMHLPFAWHPEKADADAAFEGDFADELDKAQIGGETGTRQQADGTSSFEVKAGSGQGTKKKKSGAGSSSFANDEELEAIFRRTFGVSKHANLRGQSEMEQNDLFRTSSGGWRKKKKQENSAEPGTALPQGKRRPFVSIPNPKESYLLVDGYNIIFAWDELKELAAVNLDSARQALIDVLSNYQGYRGMQLIVVFDAYRVRGNQGEVQKYGNIYVVYTKEAETADQYIEKTVHDMRKQHRVTVATSDNLEQIIVFGEGAVRMSARELYLEIQAAGTDMHERFFKREQKLENKIPAIKMQSCNREV